MPPERWKLIEELTADAIELQPDVTRTAAPLLTKAAPLRTPSADDGGLAPDVLKKALDRLGQVALAYAISYFGVHLVNELVVHGAGGLPYRLSDHWPRLAVTVTAILLSVIFFLLIRIGRIAPSSVVRIGLPFEIAGGFGMALGDYLGGAPPGPTILGPLWLCVWIVAFPLLIPSPPRKGTAAALITAATAPAALAIAVAAGSMSWPSTSGLLATLLPVLLCAVLASVLGRIIYRMGKDLKKAQQLGSYRLDALIGRGGMGEVWVAQHHMLARPAALKLIRPEVLWQGQAFGSAIQHFEQEAQHTAGLTSPHTIKLYDYGTTADGILYYAMELLEGLDLETLVRRFGAVPPARAVHFLEQTCQSLAEAHERGLVHRDIKPANVFACRQGLEYDFAKVLDFGLVKRHGDGASAAAQQGGDRQFAGTPGYMAPESIADGKVDPRSDLYAVGCLGYWLLTGRRVFDGEKLRDLVVAHLEATPVPPSARAAQAVPPALDRLILECLDKRPAGRPSSAAELRTGLLAVAVAQPWTQEQARAWWMEHAARFPKLATMGNESETL